MKASIASLFLCMMPLLPVASEGIAKRGSGHIKIDEYHNVSIEQERKRLRVFALELKEAGPEAIGYILAYGGRRTCSGEGKERGVRAKSYLVAGLNVDAERIVVIDGGYRHDPTVELWLGFPGQPAPAALPSLEPSQVKVMKRCGRVMSRRRA
jgi:hypothetical protein